MQVVEVVVSIVVVLLQVQDHQEEAIKTLGVCFGILIW
jgi:hypothetical protein